MKCTLTTTIAVTCFIFALALGAQADEFFQDSSMSPGSHWNQAYWTNAANPAPIVPSPGNTYVNDVGDTRSATDEDFLGDQLTLKSGRKLILKHSGTVTVNLVMEDGSLMSNGGSSGLVAGTLTGSGAIIMGNDGFASRTIQLDALLLAGNTFSSITCEKQGTFNVTDASNTFTGTWNVTSGTLKGVGFGQAAGFSVGSAGTLDFDADFVNSNGYLTVDSGGTLVLDQDLVFDLADFGVASLMAGTYTASELWADPATSNAIDSTSTPGSTVTVLSDPAVHKIALFTFDANNGVSSDAYAYSDVDDWDLSNAGTGAAYTNATYTAFNGTANVAANKVGTSASPVDGNYHSFSFTVTDLPPGEFLYMANLSLDYTYLTPLSFRMRIYSSVTGQNPGTFTTGDTPIYDTGAISSGSSTEVSVALTDSVFQGLKNGDSIEFRFVLTDGSGADYRIHGIDNVVLTAYTDDAPLLKHVEIIKLCDENSTTNYWLSVYPGDARYDGRQAGGEAGIIGDGTVVDYGFYNGVGISGPPYTLNKYASGGGGVVGDATATVSHGDGMAIESKVWTVTDPGPDFSTPADFDETYSTFANVHAVTNRLNISRYVSGSVWVLYGAFVGPTTNTVTMSGPGQPDLTVTHVVDYYSYADQWISRFDFANALNYDTIIVTYDCVDPERDASRARYKGVIFDGEKLPDAGTIILIR